MLNNFKANSEKRLEELVQFQKQCIGFRDKLFQSDKPGNNLYASCLRVEHLDNKLGSCSILYLKIVKMGGQIETYQNIFTSWYKYAGGAAVSYLLFDQDGKLSKSGLVSHFTKE